MCFNAAGDNGFCKKIIMIQSNWLNILCFSSPQISYCASSIIINKQSLVLIVVVDFDQLLACCLRKKSKQLCRGQVGIQCQALLRSERQSQLQQIFIMILTLINVHIIIARIYQQNNNFSVHYCPYISFRLSYNYKLVAWPSG